MRDRASHFARGGEAQGLPQPFLRALALVDHHAQIQPGQRECRDQRLQLDDRQGLHRVMMDAQHDADLHDGDGHYGAVHAVPDRDPDERQEHR